MEGGVNIRNWADLFPDALGLIFSKLCLQETFTIVPRVCKSWNQAVLGPYCWQHINILEWSYRSNPDHIDHMVRVLVARSGGAIREISVSGVPNDLTFVFLADHARSLQTLQIPRCNITDTIFEQISPNFSTVTFMDLSYCCKLTSRALSAIGISCPALTVFFRNMHPIDLQSRAPQLAEAHAIASTMPNLTHLELAYNCLDTTSVVEIIERCNGLEFLDIRGCWDVRLDQEWLEKRGRVVHVLGPDVVDRFEGHSCSDYSDTDSLFDGLWDDEYEYEEDEVGGRLELRFYEGFSENYCNGWV